VKGYREDLAFIHDAGFAQFSRQSAPFLLALLRQSGIRRGTIVDLGCGSGVWAERLCGAGYDVIGIDASPAMLALARRRAPRATFRRESFLGAELPPCDAVTSLGECLSYALDPGLNARSLARLFRRVHEALREPGLFVFDLCEPGRGVRRLVERSGRGWAVRIEAEEDRARRILTRRLTTLRQRNGGHRRGHEVHRLRLFDRRLVARQLRVAGFRVRVVRGYGRRRFAPGHVGFLARK
jgi:SAM-dependent methyltransferase